VEIISHCVWLYYRFPLSFREVEEMMLERGVVVTYETIRQWCRKLGQAFANGLRRRRARPGDKWHLDEVCITIHGKTRYLWRAVDQDGVVLDILVTSRRDTKAATRFFRQLLIGPGVRAPGAGHRQAGQLRCGPPTADAQCGAPPLEVSEQPGRKLPSAHEAARTGDEKVHFPGHAQRFLSAFSGISPHFRPRHHRLIAAQYRHEMNTRFTPGTRSPD
jgi:putative transposase